MSPICKTVIGFEPWGKSLTVSFRTINMSRSISIAQIATVTAIEVRAIDPTLTSSGTLAYL